MDATKIDAVDPRAAHALDVGAGRTTVIRRGTTVTQRLAKVVHPVDDAVHALGVGSTVDYHRDGTGLTIIAVSPARKKIALSATGKSFGEAFHELKHFLAIEWNQLNTPPRKRAAKKKTTKKKAAAKSTTRSSKSPRA